MRTILLGMCNPNADGDPLSIHDGAGKRLFEMSGMPEEVYLKRFIRLNLVDSVQWDSEKAKAGAGRFLRSLERGRIVVVLGKQVALALGVGLTNFFDDMEVKTRRFILIPHPSGRCRLYNDKKTVAKVRKLLASL